MAQGQQAANAPLVPALATADMCAYCFDSITSYFDGVASHGQ